MDPRFKSSYAYYVGTGDPEPQNEMPRDRLLLGPFRSARDADLCVERVRQIAAHVPGSPDPDSIHRVLREREARWEHDAGGEFIPFFPRGVIDPHRREADTVQYWRSQREEDVVRWVAFEEGEPGLVVGRGQIAVPDHSQDPRPLVQRRVQRQDPVLAQHIRHYRDDLAPREAAVGEPHRTTQMSALMLDLGMMLMDPSDGKFKAITYRRRFRLDSEVHFQITFSFDDRDPVGDSFDVGDHHQFQVLDVNGLEINLKPDFTPAPDVLYRAPKKPVEQSVDANQGMLFGGF